MWLTLQQQQATQESLVEMLGSVCELEQQMKKRSASSASALVCGESGLSLLWFLDWKDEAVLVLWSAKEEQFDLVKNRFSFCFMHKDV